MYFITFITEGYPYDGGFDLTETGNKIKEKLSDFFEEVFIFTKRTLKQIPGSEEVCNSFLEPLDNNPNANHIGYFDFKPFLIQHVLTKVPEGSLVLYHDGNFNKSTPVYNFWPQKLLSNSKYYQAYPVNIVEPLNEFGSMEKFLEAVSRLLVCVYVNYL